MISLAEELALLAIEDDGAVAYTAGQAGFGMALIGACLVDLNGQGRLDADLTAVHILSRTPTGDPMLDLVLGEMGADTLLSVEQWVLQLAPQVPKLVQLSLSALVKRGILDGRRGFRYCVLKMFYEYQVSLKIEELNDPDSPMSEKYRHLLNR